MKDLKDWIIKAEQDVVLGKGQEIKAELQRIQHQGVPHRDVVRISKLANRVGMFHFSAMILSKKLEEDWRKTAPKVLAPYANSLAGLGNYTLAKEIFSFIPIELQNEYALFYSDCLFREWRYEEGAQVLLNVDTSKMTGYQLCVFKVNLASAYILAGKTNKALEIIKSTLKVCTDESYVMLRGNCFELLGQIDFNKGSLNEALKSFEKSEALLRNTKNVSWLYAMKWLRLCQMKVNGVDKKGLEKLNEVRTMAREFKHWESLRDIDLHQSIMTEDQSLFSHCYWGTPHEAFRKYALKLAGHKITAHSTVVVSSGRKGPSMSYNLQSGLLEVGQKKFDFSLYQPLCRSLFKDLYRPRTIFELFRDVYDEPFFNKITSPGKMYKKIQKFRGAIDESKVNLVLTSSKKYGYRLRSNSPLTIDYTSPQEDPVLQKIKNQFFTKAFSCSELVEVANIPQRSANRWLKEMVEKGKLIKVGSGKSTRYKVDKAGSASR